MENQIIQLTELQQKFVEQFTESENQRNMLIAAAGTGKTATSINAACRKLKTGKCEKLVIISDRLVLCNQWKYAAKDYELNLSDEISQLTENSSDGISITYQSLLDEHRIESLIKVASRGGLLLIADEVDRYQTRAVTLCNKILAEDPSNQCLFISRTPIIGQPLDWKYEFGREYLFEPELIQLPETQSQITRFSPSICLLEKFRQRVSSLDDLNWRQFEILISELLESDGYEIELMSGTKDGGVDIIAIKDLGELGMFKTLWQAKKYKISRKIGISTIRELADVRNEFKASKAFIITSSFLTSGALERIQRDKYLLGKIDRNDLNAWINRKLYE